MGVLVLKRTSDKLDAVFAAAVLILGLAVFGIYLGAPRLTCVPTSCQGRPSSANCARDWAYLSSQCEQSFLSYPDTNFHYLLLLASALFFGLLGSPIFYGNPACTELFATFSTIWKLKNNDPITKDVEWRRKMHLILDQLKSGATLTKNYSIYHGIGLVIDSLSLLLVSLYTLHFFDFSLPTSYFAVTKTEDANFVCDMPNKSLFQWFGVATALVLLGKTINRLLCVGFAAAFPGLFGRNIVLYADEIVDKNDENVYNIQNNPIAILYHVLAATLQTVLVAPVQKIRNFFQFYCHKLADETGADEKVYRPVEVVEPAPPAPVEEHAPGTNGFATPVEIKRIRQLPAFYHNWSDLFFIMDVMSGGVDICDILIFISKTDDLIPIMDDKKVDVHLSRLDVATNTLTVSYTDAGIIEKLLDVELYSSGGLSVIAWLEGPTGRVEANPSESGSTKNPTFPVTMGTSYELISAVFGNGKMLVRLPNFSFHPPQELKARHKKKYGLNVPLVAFTQNEGRPLSLNFDIGR